MNHDTSTQYILAMDTSNEVIVIGLGRLDEAGTSIDLVAHEETSAHRTSNTQLLPHIDAMLGRLGISPTDIACICVGGGPGSFTGVRIAMATAKGMATSLEVALVGVSTQEAIAWGAWSAKVRGRLLVISDAMRKEVYPAYFDLAEDGVRRISPDAVVKAQELADALPDDPHAQEGLLIAGDALTKYRDLLEPHGEVLPESLWTPTGAGLLDVVLAHWRAGEVDPTDADRHDPVGVLPIYTRLSDAEENERIRLAHPRGRDLRTGVQGSPDADGVDALEFAPLDSVFADDVALMEAALMGTDAWTSDVLVDDMKWKSHTWWMATCEGRLIGYAGAMLAGDDMEILKVAVAPEQRRNGVACELLSRIAYDGENLAASSMSLEVRESNVGALAFYRAIGFEEIGKRSEYYSDGEDAILMRASIRDVVSSGTRSALEDDAFEGASENLAQSAQGISKHDICHPLIIAIESSCDETAASVIDGTGTVLSDIVSSQVDFHARFGGVVPEIASRKHVEAIVGVTRLALEEAASSIGAPSLSWSDLDAVAVTYAPGLVGALVVGVAFAKGAAWAVNKPIIAVNHLEGHLYANKLAQVGEGSSFQPPAVVSLVSGGNTMLVFMRDWQDYEILGATIDDAVGEAFDKVAKALGLPYPGGPHISRLAEDGDPHAIDFPRALLHSGDYRFSLSGLKTAVATYINRQREQGLPLDLPDICASFQQAVIDVQVSKAKRALEETGAQTFCLGGGVAANPALREAYERMCDEMGVRVLMPPLSACGDNAAMIALVALDRYNEGAFASLGLDAEAHADLSQRY